MFCIYVIIPGAWPSCRQSVGSQCYCCQRRAHEGDSNLHGSYCKDGVRPGTSVPQASPVMPAMFSNSPWMGAMFGNAP